MLMLDLRKHIRYFELAKKLSKKSNHHQYKLGCVIVKGKKIVGLGYNQLKSHPKSPHKWSQIHAEFHALIGTHTADLQGASVYVFRQNKHHELAIAKPCKCCEKMLRDCNVKRVFFTVGSGYESYSFY